MERAKGINCMLADGNYIFGDKQAVVYTELEICYTHETNVINQCYVSKKLKIHENSSKKKKDMPGWEIKSEILLHAVCSALFPIFYFIP